ncbi:MAG TPA: serine/threonine-protein kinase [Micromonospora sp.]|nr:serine/threonine-protein kinase [Micromonospora sp.]
MMFTPDMRLADRYQIVTRLGVGGMSEVWRATDELLGRPVAIKALATPLAADPALRDGTRREARAAARLTHPHVTHVYDYGEVPIPDGAPVPYLVMELVEGRDLAHRLSKGPLPWRDAVRVAAQVAAGLAAAHRMGVVHRDIKPGNVMLTANGAKILDFGIAALAGGQPETDAGWLIGTPAYAAPERLRAGSADPAGDVYALGVLLFECLTGRKPIPVRNWEEMAAAHRKGVRITPPQVPGLPAEVATLCLACLSPDPGRRPTAGDIATRLRAVVGGPDMAPADLAATQLTPLGPVHPPTLIDRSLAGPPPAEPQPQERPRGVAAAPVVPQRPAVGHGVEETGAAAPADRPPRSRLAIVAAAGALLAGGLTLALIAAAFRADPVPNGGRAPSITAPTSAATATSVPPAARTAPPAQSTPTSDRDVVHEFDRLLTELVAAEQITPKVAKKLRDKLDGVRKELGERKFPKKANDLRKKIRDYLKDGEITPEIADRLHSALQPLLTSGHGTNGDDDDDGDDD